MPVKSRNLEERIEDLIAEDNRYRSDLLLAQERHEKAETDYRSKKINLAALTLSQSEVTTLEKLIQNCATKREALVFEQKKAIDEEKERERTKYRVSLSKELRAEHDAMQIEIDEFNLELSQRAERVLERQAKINLLQSQLKKDIESDPKTRCEYTVDVNNERIYSEECSPNNQSANERINSILSDIESNGGDISIVKTFIFINDRNANLNSVEERRKQGAYLKQGKFGDVIRMIVDTIAIEREFAERVNRETAYFAEQEKLEAKQAQKEKGSGVVGKIRGSIKALTGFGGKTAQPIFAEGEMETPDEIAKRNGNQLLL